MEQTKALSPEEIMKGLPGYFPNAVIEAVNSLLMEKYRGTRATIKQCDIVAKILSLDENISRDEIFDKKYLDFESIFEEQGWKVSYDKPAYNETYEAFYEFTKTK